MQICPVFIRPSHILCCTSSVYNFIKLFHSEDDTEEHFAGFLIKAPDRNIDDDPQHPKSKKEAMAEVVTNSKIQKVYTYHLFLL